MGKVIKIVAGLLLGLVVLVVAAAIVLPMVIDPNDHKPEIVAAVKEHTGRTLALNSDLELSVFPWLGLRTQDVVMGNASGFADQPFAKVTELSVRAKLLPLLQGRVEVDTLVLDGLQVNLEIDQSGRSNWQDLAKPSKQETAEDKAAKAGAAVLVQGVQITNAGLNYSDARTGEAFAFSNVRLTTGALAPGAEVLVAAGFSLKIAKPARELSFALEGALRLDESLQKISIKDLVTDLQTLGEGLPEGGVKLSLNTELLIDLQADQLKVSGLQVQTDGLTLNGDLLIEQLQSQPQLQGTLNLPKSNVRALMQRFGIELATAEPTALSAVSADLQIKQEGSVYRISPLKLQLDQSTLQGQLSVTPSEVLGLKGDLKVDRLNLDHYLPPAAQELGSEDTAASQSPTQTPTAAKAAPAVKTASTAQASANDKKASAEVNPLAVLHTLDVDLALKVESLIVSKAKLQDVVVKLRNKDGQMKIAPFQAALYDGKLDAMVSVDARTNTPAFHAKKSLNAINIGQLLADVVGEDRLLGKGDLQLDLTTRGLDPKQQQANLNGNGRFTFRDGAYKGVNIAAMLRKAGAALGMSEGGSADASNQTDFSELSASFTARQGVISNQDLEAKSPLLRISGKGEVNLPAETIDYRLTTELVQSLQGQGGQAADKLAGVPIPVKIQGKLSSPSYKPDLESAVKAKAKERVQEEVKKKLEGAVGDKLKGLFGF